MDYEPITEREDEMCLKESELIFVKLREKFPEENVKDFNMLLNVFSLCLIRLAMAYTRKEDSEQYSKIIQKIISENLQREEY